MKNDITAETQFQLLKSSIELQELWNNMTSEERNMLFFNCTTITTIPDDLFLHCTEMTNYNNIFKNTKDEYKN